MIGIVTSERRSVEKYGVPATRVYMKKWISTAFKFRLCIYDWPDCVALPGPNFDIKALDKASFVQLLEGYKQNQTEKTDVHSQPYIERWASRKFFPLPRCLCSDGLFLKMTSTCPTSMRGREPSLSSSPLPEM
jgi:hypothetical protein